VAVAAGETTTFHLAPVIVAGAASVSWNGRRSIGAAIGFGLATAAALGLAAFGLLGGPSILPIGGALLESVTGAAAGGLAGALLPSRQAPELSHSRP
jgi:hypothetical protein